MLRRPDPIYGDHLAPGKALRDYYLRKKKKEDRRRSEAKLRAESGVEDEWSDTATDGKGGDNDFVKPRLLRTQRYEY